jgi:hypothetical protein
VHFDVSLGAKAKALAAGAVLMDMFAPAEFVARQRGNTAMLAQIENSRQLRGLPADGRVRTEVGT